LWTRVQRFIRRRKFFTAKLRSATPGYFWFGKFTKNLIVVEE